MWRDRRIKWWHSDKRITRKITRWHFLTLWTVQVLVRIRTAYFFKKKISEWRGWRAVNGKCGAQSLRTYLDIVVHRFWV